MKKTIEEMMEEDGVPILPEELVETQDQVMAPDRPAPDLFVTAKMKEFAKRKYPILGKLRDHQVRAMSEADEKNGHAWFMDPGAGKTLTAIAEAGRLYEAGKIDGMIVTAPNGVHIQWLEEQLPQWAGFRWKGIHNKMPPVRGIDAFFNQRITSLGVLCINHDALRTPDGEALIDRFIEKFPRIYLVADESHKFKDSRSRRTKELLKLGLRATYRRALSGTPVLKGLEDLWSQYEFVEAGLAWHHQPISVDYRGTLNTYGFMGYRSHYCKLAPVPGNPRASRIVGYRNEDELRRHVSPYSTRVMADEFMKGEKPDFITVHCPMSETPLKKGKPTQKRQYVTMKTNLMAEMDKGMLTAQNALVKMTKLRQIASGFLYHEDDLDQWEQYGSNKINAAMDLVEMLDEPVIIWAPLRALHRMMEDELNHEGYGKHIYFREEVDRWKKDDNGILIGNQTSGLGVGMNLQHAAANIYLSNDYSAEARWQSLKRTDRIGQTRQVRNWDLVAPNTVDVSVLEALASKEDISRRTIDELRNMI